MTREHVFARWLVQRVHGARLVATAGITASGTTALPMRVSRVTAPVCGECNAGWMSVLEVSFRQAVFARPRVGALFAPDRITLSRWFTKTAVLLADAYGCELHSPAERAPLLTGMPDGVEVFLARGHRPRQHLDFALDLGERTEQGPQLRSVAIRVDDLVGHVAPRGTLTRLHGTRLWPLRSFGLRWDTLPVRAFTPSIA